MSKKKTPFTRGLRWVSNISRERADGTPDPGDIIESGGDYKEARRYLKEWLKGKIIGNPKPTKQYSVAALKKEGLVGLYEPN